MPQKSSAQDTLETILSQGLVPVFSHEDPEVVVNVARACYKGGLRTFEFTNRVKGGIEIFHRLKKFRDAQAQELILGVGSLLGDGEAEEFLSAGAEFAVGPNYCPRLLEKCRRTFNIPYAPGCATPSEIVNALHAGAELIKVFPGNILGPEFVKTVLGPISVINGPVQTCRIMPTGGVDASLESLTAWFNAGVVAVGMGSKLILKDHVQKQQWEEIGERVRQVLKWVAEARGQK